MSQLYTSDTHLGHARIIQYARRPFESREHMDRVLIQRLREAKATGASLIHCGDLSFDFAQQVRRYGPLWPESPDAVAESRDLIVLGNHDRTHKPALLDAYMSHFHLVCGPPTAWATNSIVVDDALDGHAVKVLVSHKPQKDLRGADVNVHGHQHNSIFFQAEGHHEEDHWSFASPVHFNASVELHDYRPVALQQLADAHRSGYAVAKADLIQRGILCSV